MRVLLTLGIAILLIVTLPIVVIANLLHMQK